MAENLPLRFTVAPEDDGGRLDCWLARQVPDLSRSRLQSLMAEGCLASLSGGVLKPSQKVRSGEVYILTIPPPVPAVPQPQDIPLSVVYEDADLIVIDKPAGLVVHPAAGHADGTLVNALLYHCDDLAGVGGELRPGIVHRLDKDTSGLMLAAKNEFALNALTDLFKRGLVRKTYLARVHGCPNPPAGRLETMIGRHPSHRQQMANVSRNGKLAITNYETIALYPNATALLRCRIETGRTHQIRVHLAGIGCPIVGDPLYGNAQLDRRLQAPQRQLLHSAQLALPHPRSGEALSFSAPAPAVFSFDA
ncbi:MAG: RluA family pseudouridine synthase [Kiritimatiellia bacterium]|nr:RluA family pseudouridine synthase [Kiritimatiellia bacterium]